MQNLILPQFFIALCFSIALAVELVSDAADPVCVNYKCSKDAKKCIEIGDKTTTIYPCSKGERCEGEPPKCVKIDVPTPPKKFPGYKASNKEECHSGVLDGKYCKGLDKDAACTPGSATELCNVGLYCDGTDKKCVAQIAEGSECKAGAICQGNCFCNTDGNKCTKYFTLDNDKTAYSPLYCKSGYISGNKCATGPALTSAQWIGNDKPMVNACEYKDTKLNAACAAGSGDATKTGYCADYSKISTSSQSAYMTSYVASSCTASVYACDKALDAIGCSKYQTAAKESASGAIEMEKYNVDCVAKTVTDTVNGLCGFSSKLVFGLLSFFAILLLL